MSAGTIVRILCGRMRGKRAEVVAINGSRALVRGAFGPATYLLNELEAIS